MLHFIYKDTLDEDDVPVGSGSPGISVPDTLAAKLLAAADKYGLGRLRLMCESYLCKDISVNSVASTLALADRFHAMELKAACLRFAAENLSGIVTEHKFFRFFFTCTLGFCMLNFVYRKSYKPSGTLAFDGKLKILIGIRTYKS